MLGHVAIGLQATGADGQDHGNGLDATFALHWHREQVKDR